LGGNWKFQSHLATGLKNAKIPKKEKKSVGTSFFNGKLVVWCPDAFQILGLPPK